MVSGNTLTIIFSGLVAVSTVVYAILTWRLVSETRKMRISQIEPMISIKIESSENYLSLMNLTIVNDGLGPAYDICFNLDTDFEHNKGKFLSEHSIFKNGLKYLAPRQSITFFLTSLLVDSDKKLSSKLIINVSYYDRINTLHKDMVAYDFSELKSVNRIGEPPLFTISKALININDNINKISNGTSRLSTIVYNQEDILKEKEKKRQDIESRKTE